MKQLKHWMLLFAFHAGLFLPIISTAQNNDNQTGITPGILTFTVKSVTNNSSYSPKNVLAIWIKDASGNFVVSLKVMANARKQHLVKWKTSSSGNVVSAITGPTLATHQTHTVTWDGKNAAGVEMADGQYQIWVEYTSTNSASNGNQGPFMSLNFEKGPAIQHLNPANATYYQDIVADWVPLGVGIHDISETGAGVTLFPNPFSDQTTIQLSLSKTSQVYISINNVSGQKVAELVSDSFTAGTRNFQWDGTSETGQKLSNGLYFVQILVNGISETRKIVINR